MSQGGGSIFKMMGLGKKFDKAVPPTTRFTDVAGVDDAREELETVVDMLKFPEKYTAMGGVPVKGVLLCGLPGTGKTLLARAVAGEANIPFFAISASEIIEGIVGLGASRVRDLFDQAKKNSPCIVFVDEIDAVGQKRSKNPMGGHNEQEQTLNQLLTEMDGFDKDTKVIVLAATNRKELLDAALLRAGRFTRHVDFYPPDLKGRREIIDVHKVGKKLATEDKTFVDPKTGQTVTWHAANLDKLARDTTGAVGADIKEILNDSAILAARQDKDAIYMEDLDEAVYRAVMGIQRKSQVYDQETKTLVKVHECGHVIAGLFAPKRIPVSKVSIVGRGEAGGVTFWDQPDKKFRTRSELLSQMVAAYGGRAAAVSDLQHVRHIAQEMVMNFGMSERFQDIAFPQPDNFQERGYSDETQGQIDVEILSLSNEAKALAEKIMGEHRNELEALMQAIEIPESLGQDEIMKTVGLDLGDSAPQVA
jgi:cell division protease FtsH